MRTLMSDTTSAFPPPPPGGIPSPAYQSPSSPLPDYQPPAVAQPPVGYPQNWQPAPAAAVGAGWGAAGVLSQFSGSAAWACGVGLVTIIVPFAFGRVFFFLPIVGIIYGFRAIQRGKLIGGITGIVLSAIGGIVTLIGLFG
jgi:hypothetical protein